MSGQDGPNYGRSALSEMSRPTDPQQMPSSALGASSRRLEEHFEALAAAGDSGDRARWREALSEAVAASISLVRAATGALYLDDRDEVADQTADGLRLRVGDDWPVAPDEAVVQAAVTGRVQISSADAGTESLDEGHTSAPSGSVITVPLVDAPAWAVLALDFSADRTFGADVLDQLLTMGRRLGAAIEHSRLLQSRRHAELAAEAVRQQLTVLVRATESLALILDEYDTGLSRLGKLLVPLYADWFGASLIDPAKPDRELQVQWHADATPPLDWSRWQHRSECADAAARAEQDGGGLLLYRGAPGIGASDQRILEDSGFESLMIAPVLVSSFSFGTLALATRPGRRGYRSSDLDTFQTLARRLAAAIERAVTFREAKESAESAMASAALLRRLMEASLAINRPLSEEQIVEVVAEQARRITCSVRAVVTRSFGDGTVKRTTFPATLAPEVPRAADLVAAGGRSARSRQMAPEVTGDGSEPGRQGDPWLAAPLTDMAGNAVGSVVALGHAEGSFGTDDESGLVSLAQMASVALGNARLYEAAKGNSLRLQALMASAPLAMIELDLDGHARWWNPAACAMFGWVEPELAVGRPVLSEELSTQLSRLWYRAVRGQPTVGSEFPVVRDSGSTAYLSVSTAAMRTADDVVTGVMALVQDVSERRAMEDQIKEAERIEALGRLAGGVAHDLNNILSVILGYGEMVLRRTDEAAARRDIQSILDAGRRAAGLTEQLLAVGRREIGQPTAVDVNALIHDMTSMIRTVAGVDVDARLELNEVPPVRIDPAQLERVILNLVINAVDAMPEGGQLHVRTRVDATRLEDGNAVELVEVSVTDTGTGMDPETLKHCFEPFFTTKEREKGTGLGLAAVHGIVSSAGGTVTVSSRLGGGTAFAVRLPASDTRVTTEPGGGNLLRGGNEVVLVVEDERELLELARRSLEAMGYEVLAAAGGREALVLLEQMGRVDLLVTDVIMPGMSGPELVQAADKAGWHPPVLFMSGFTDSAAEKYRLPPDADLLVKPFGPDELCLRVEAALRRTGARPS